MPAATKGNNAAMYFHFLKMVLSSEFTALLSKVTCLWTYQKGKIKELNKI